MLAFSNGKYCNYRISLILEQNYSYFKMDFIEFASLKQKISVKKSFVMIGDTPNAGLAVLYHKNLF